MKQVIYKPQDSELLQHFKGKREELRQGIRNIRNKRELFTHQIETMQKAISQMNSDLDLLESIEDKINNL